jgi:hypothetical protein
LGDYKYYDMDATIDKALALCLKEFSWFLMYETLWITRIHKFFFKKLLF